MVVGLQCFGESLAVVSCCRAGLPEFSAAGIFGGVATVLWGVFGGVGFWGRAGVALISVFGDCFSFLGASAKYLLLAVLPIVHLPKFFLLNIKFRFTCGE